jgi:hypothetical protein
MLRARVLRRALSTKRPPLPHYDASALRQVEPHALDSGTALHYSLSGTGPGPMANWMYGFCNALQHSELWTPGVSCATGVSGGAINAVCLAADVDISPSSIYQAELRAALKRRPKGTGLAIRSALDAALPHDVASRIQGRARIAVVLAKGSWRERRPIIIDRFEDKEDVIGAVCASAHLPYLMDGKPTAAWRGRQYLDAAVFGFGIIHVPGAVHVSTCPPPSYTPPGQTVPGLDPLRWLLHAREGAPSDAHPWLADEYEQSSELPTGVISHACDILGIMSRRGAARERYRSTVHADRTRGLDLRTGRKRRTFVFPALFAHAAPPRALSIHEFGSGQGGLWRVVQARARIEAVNGHGRDTSIDTSRTLRCAVRWSVRRHWLRPAH